jgi:DNA polymerase III subunit beta
MNILFEGNRDVLLRPLQAVASIVERRHTLPILSNVFLEKKNSALLLLTTDLEIQISCQVPCDDAESTWSITVPARKLVDILRALPEASPIALKQEQGRLIMRSGKSRFALQTLPAEDFPKLPEAISETAELRVPQCALKRLFALVQYAMAQQDVRYYLNGLLLVIEGGKLTAVATDGHRLALASMEVLGLEEKERKELILPRKAVQELHRHLADDEEEAVLRFAGNRVLVAAGDLVIQTKVVDGRFPDYQRVIPSGYQKQFLIDRQQLQQAHTRVAILAGDKLRGVRWILTENNLRIVCHNADQEEALEELEIEYRGEALDIGFNIGYLIDVLANVPGSVVCCEFGDASSSALITLPESADFKYVVMPMRI